MIKGEDLSKINVISICLLIHIPSQVSKKMLKLAKINLDVASIEDNTYNMLLLLKWATNYEDILKELKSQNLNYLLKN